MKVLQPHRDRRSLVKAIVSVGMALAFVAGSGQAQVPSAAPSQHAYELAREVVVADGFRARLSGLEIQESLHSQQIAQALRLTDPAKQDRIKEVVHRRWQALEDDMVAARISILAQTYTVEEMEGALDFGRTPTGQALRAAAPDLNRALMTAVFGQAPATSAPPMSERKIALVKRILVAREVEASAGKGWRRLNALFSQSLSNPTKTGTPPTVSANNEAAEVAYVQRVVAAETEFYGRTFSDGQLSELATYFEGPIAHAFNEREPQATSAAATMVSKIFDRQLVLMYKEACEVVECSRSQRAALDTRLSQSRSMVATAANAIAQ